MAEPRSERTEGGGPDGPPPGSPGELDELAEGLRKAAAALCRDAAELARAQWRLTAYIVAGSARILALRLAARTAIAALCIACWCFLNVAVWRAVGHATDLAFLPPAALFALNAAAAAGLHAWQKGLKLE